MAHQKTLEEVEEDFRNRVIEDLDKLLALWKAGWSYKKTMGRRLIDVDKFKADYGMKDDCADCDKELRGKSKACEFDRVYTKMDFCGWLEYAPTVDAVPVDDVFALAIALNKEIEVLGLSVRAYHALSRRACRTVGDVYRLLKSGEIKKVRNLGDKSIGEIEDRLCEYLPYLWRTEGR